MKNWDNYKYTENKILKQESDKAWYIKINLIKYTLELSPL